MYPQGVCRIRFASLVLATAALYFSFFKLKKWGKKTAETRRHNCAVLPSIKRLKTVLFGCCLCSHGVAAKRKSIHFR